MVLQQLKIYENNSKKKKKKTKKLYVYLTPYVIIIKSCESLLTNIYQWLPVWKVDLKAEDLLACLAFWTFKMFELGKIIFGLGHSNIVFQITLCKANRKADIMNTGTVHFGHSFWRQKQWPVMYSLRVIAC